MALDCSGLKPEPPKETTTSFVGKLDASVNSLFAKLATAGAKVEGTYSNVAKNVLDEFPNADKLYMWERVLFLQCQLLGDSKTLTDKERLDSITGLYLKLRDPVPAIGATETNAGSPITNTIKNDGNGNIIIQGKDNNVK
jgi:hypothetical protein